MPPSNNPLITRYGTERRWVCWRYELRDGKRTKVPMQPSGRMAKSNDVSTWSTYDEVASVDGMSGVGIIFTPERTLLGIDLDHVIGEDGALVPSQRGAIEAFLARADSYTELSPSGTGLHVYLELSEEYKPLASRHTFMDGEVSRGYELYTAGRFFTVSEVPWHEDGSGRCRALRTVPVSLLSEILAPLGYPWGPVQGESEHNASFVAARTQPASVSGGASTLDDSVLMERMFAAKNGVAIRALWEGDLSGHNGDDSAADMALCGHLAFWTGKDAARMERLWLASGLGQRSKVTGRADYRTRTIENAIRTVREVYEAPVRHTGMEGDVKGIFEIRENYLAAKQALKNAQESGADDKEIKQITEWLKGATSEYVAHFHEYFALQYPHLLYERGEDKIFWNYDEREGIYVECSQSWVRGLLVRLLIDEGLSKFGTASYTRDMLIRYRGYCQDRAVPDTAFDHDDAWFHAANGWLHLETRTFEPHTTTRLSRRKSAVSYDPHAVCPNYDALLDAELELKKDVVRVLDQFSGLILTHDMRNQQMLTIIGDPGCGKSTLIETWMYVLGDMATKKKLSKIGNSDGSRFMGTEFVGRTLCWFDEVDVKRAELDNDIIDRVTGETIEVERKGIQKHDVHNNYTKTILTANSLPYSATHGIYRRLLYIPIERPSFQSAGIMRLDMKNTLRSESSGILNRMLKGLDDLRRMGGFTVIAGNAERIESIKVASNKVAEFLDEHFDPVHEWNNEVHETLTARDLLTAYKRRMGEERWQHLTPAVFGKMLRQQPLEVFKNCLRSKRNERDSLWIGITLKKGLSWSDDIGGERYIVQTGSREERFNSL